MGHGCPSVQTEKFGFNRSKTRVGPIVHHIKQPYQISSHSLLRFLRKAWRKFVQTDVWTWVKHNALDESSWERNVSIGHGCPTRKHEVDVRQIPNLQRTYNKSFKQHYQVSSHSLLLFLRKASGKFVHMDMSKTLCLQMSCRGGIKNLYLQSNHNVQRH